MRLGGFSYAGGTCRFGGSVDAEERFYHLLQRVLGDGAYNKDEEGVRARMLMGIARGMALMENEAIKQSRESVSSWSIAQMVEWLRIFGIDRAAGIFPDTSALQRVMRSVEIITANMANIRLVEREVERLIQDEAYGFENTGATIKGLDGDRYWCVLVPTWMAEPEYLMLYRATKFMMQRWAPAHTVPCLCTSWRVAPSMRPAFYLDGYRGCAVGKDCCGQ